jgi:hypothetical protein
MVVEVTSNFCYCHLKSSWGHKGISHQKWILLFVILVFKVGLWVCNDRKCQGCTLLIL